MLPVEFSFVLAKGRSNYISLRRLAAAVDRAQSTFFQEKEFEQLPLDPRLVAKRQTTAAAAISTSGRCRNVWDEVASDRGNCLGKKCPTYNECFYYQARRRAWNADVVDRQSRPVLFGSRPCAARERACCPITTS